MANQPTIQLNDEQKNPPRRVEIKVPEIYKQVDESVWQELEQYIYTGFLVSHAVVQDQSFVFKTMNPYELRYIQYMRPAGEGLPHGNAAFRNAFIAHSIFMVDGNNCLYERPRHINRLIKAIAKLSPKMQDSLIESLGALNERAALLFPLVEAYAYENRSRFRWLQVKNQSIHSPLSTGVAGTDEIGMNVCQQTWVALNNVIDRQEETERDWQHAKFIGSCFAGKGIRAVEEKDRGRREKEKTDREDLKMRVLYAYLNRKIGKDVEDEEPVPVQLPDGRFAQVVKRFKAETAEELADQLSRSLSGEMDHHDMIIEAKMKQAQQRAEEKEAFKRSLMTRDPVFSEVAGGGSARILGGKAEADAYVKRMKDLEKEQIQRAARQEHFEQERNRQNSDGRDQ
jgi:hypothetical protein